MHKSLPALIVAHGQPSDPAPAGFELAQLAQAVAQYAPARRIGAATLAEDGALAAALEDLGPRGLVFPMFMAGGWFTRVALGERLRHAAGGQGWQVLEPFGCEASLHELARDVVAEALTGQDLSRAEVLVAAHGSFKSSAPADVAQAVAATLRRDLGLARVDVAFIDQKPQLRDATGFGAGAICLPFFAANGGHVTTDLPRALAEARFGGRVLPPIGLHPNVPALIAAALGRAAPVCAQNCRHSAAPAPH
ncbi:MAG: CbiX/SirB N-terminal domain-containing protein [Cypionkella sp.]|nr:CbiX/SirB N-terminal domain-containing protein [Cypionkella sp.]